MDFYVSRLVTSLLKSAVAEQKANTPSAVLLCFPPSVVDVGTGQSGGGSCFRRTRCERTQPLLSASGRVRVAAGLERLSRGSPCAAAACGGGRPGRCSASW